MKCDNQNSCPCTYSCANHAKCCACVAYHNRDGEFPACFFTAKAEKAYDRSFERLAEDRRQK
jgi:hypothetical protein